jgi:hypothetical protein
MALADIRHEVVHSLAETNEAIREASALLISGDDFEKVVAAGELDFLGRQRAMLKMRLAQVDRRLAEGHGFFSPLRQVWFSLMFHLESWLAHG